MDINTYLGGLISGAVALMAIWGFVKVIKEIKKDNDTEHDRRKRLDAVADIVEKNKDDWNKGLKDIYAEQGRIVEHFNTQLVEQDQKMDMIKCDQEAKNQQLLSMMCMCLRAQDAILEALSSKDIGNGEIKAMHKELKDFIMEQVQQ